MKKCRPMFVIPAFDANMSKQKAISTDNVLNFFVRLTSVLFLQRKFLEVHVAILSHFAKKRVSLSISLLFFSQTLLPVYKRTCTLSAFLKSLTLSNFLKSNPNKCRNGRRERVRSCTGRRASEKKWTVYIYLTPLKKLAKNIQEENMMLNMICYNPLL